jgi:signal transduction histidine kinase
MQTPLAVIRTKVETLMQEPGLSEEQAAQIVGIDNALERLNRLFNSLLLLTKIENRQFPVSEMLRLDEIVAERIQELQEIVQDRNIAIHSDLEVATVHCNRYLIEVFVSNLLNNAIRYNYSGGGIHIRLRRNSLMIANTSMLPQLNPEAIFRPFYRHSDSRVDGNGLGLSIVRQICDLCGFSVEYDFAQGAHQFSVHFPGPEAN